jgi:hypothetical protein
MQLTQSEAPRIDSMQPMMLTTVEQAKKASEKRKKKNVKASCFLFFVSYDNRCRQRKLFKVLKNCENLKAVSLSVRELFFRTASEIIVVFQGLTTLEDDKYSFRVVCVDDLY